MFNAGVYQGLSVRCDIPAVLQLLDTVLAEASAKQLDIVQFPELFLCGYDIASEDTMKLAVEQGGYEFKSMKEMAKKHNIAFGIGYAEADEGNIYNSCCIIDASGAVVLNYRKTHLWDPTLEGEKVTFVPGSELPVATLSLPRANVTITIGILICFDCEFPEPARVLAIKGADVILISTAICDDATPQLMIPCRAAENHATLIYSNLTGLNRTFPSSFVQGTGIHAGSNVPPTGTCFCGQSAIVASTGVDLVRATRTDTGLFSASIDLNAYPEHKRRNDYLKERRPELYTLLT